MSTARPRWLNTNEYPFEPHFFKSPAGTMHYVDEGTGDPVVFVHGNPVWSYVYRHVISSLSDSYRCIAPDHIGFGLSDKPADWSYLPKDHAANLEALLDSLDLHNVTLVVNDWGGPTGIAYAIRHPERIRALVIANTWLWRVDSDWHYLIFSALMGGPVGQWLTHNFNFFAQTFLPVVFGDKSKLTAEVHRQYTAPFALPDERKGMWVFPKQIIDSSAWLDSLWSQIGVLRDKSVLLPWGMKDIAFREQELKTWQEAFPDAKTVMYPDSGHYLAEEHPLEMAIEIRSFLAGRQ